jgi:hypothetical protein
MRGRGGASRSREGEFPMGQRHKCWRVAWGLRSGEAFNNPSIHSMVIKGVALLNIQVF